jgi:hypothetical protein
VAFPVVDTLAKLDAFTVDPTFVPLSGTIRLALVQTSLEGTSTSEIVNPKSPTV